MKRKIAIPLLILSALAVIVGSIFIDVYFIKWLLHFQGGIYYVMFTHGIFAFVIFLLLVEKK